MQSERYEKVPIFAKEKFVETKPEKNLSIIIFFVVISTDYYREGNLYFFDFDCELRFLRKSAKLIILFMNS
jgi:hypothetical protein